MKMTKSMFMSLKKLHKKFTQNLENLEENMQEIENVDNDSRKEKVKAISNEIYDLTEHLHDLDLLADELIGDDLLDIDDQEIYEKFEKIDLIFSLIHTFEKDLKNMHKTFYDKKINADLKILAHDSLKRSWKSLNRQVSTVLNDLESIINKIS
jgi:hypothetical protein